MSPKYLEKIEVSLSILEIAFMAGEDGRGMGCSRFITDA